MKEKIVNNYKKFIPGNEEIRNGLKITTNRKKVRDIELGILNEIKKICERHSIKYYADAGTLLGAIRHNGFIPRDDDIDITMFRDDYEKFSKIAERELPNHLKIREYGRGFSKISNINTAAFGQNNRRDKEFIGGISIDIFPMDYASKSNFINHTKSVILRFLRRILLANKSNGNVNNMKNWKNFVINTSNFIFNFCKIKYTTVYRIHENISKKTIFKGNNVFNSFITNLFFPKKIYDKSHDMKFEYTTICVPDGYDEYLSIRYGDYMKPVIFSGGHNCRYSVDKSYKDIIKTFDKSKSNEENYKNCKDLFVLD